MEEELNTEASDKPPKIPKPSEYMRSNRPYLFSDSEPVRSQNLERSELEYFLETLTSRKQEYVFEEFCRRLAEVELCPNLRTQTGPLGGGDSKMDTSTYPVAVSLAERCYWGSPNQPVNERWAFAFSCMKKWTSKVRSDVKKIAKLDVEWSKIFFITSQFARDKTRARIEDELAREHGVEVCILDREWIIDRVFSHKREEIAVEVLGISKSPSIDTRMGPADTARRNELDDLLMRLREPLKYFNSDYGIAGAYLRAAKLARGLELPRHEVDGFFGQARQMAKKTKYAPQIVHAAYEHAWADNWWYDDTETAVQVYDEIETHLDAMTEASELEMFANLQSLIWVAGLRNEVDTVDVKLDERRGHLNAALQRQADDQTRPNNALQAETMLRFMELQPWNDEAGRPFDEVFQDIASCFERSRKLSTYPLTRFTDTVLGLADFFDPTQGLDDLFEKMRTLVAERDGEIAVARMLLQQGKQLQNATRYKEAALVFVEACTKASKEECLELSVDAAFLASTSFTGEGLILAARLPALYAASLSCTWTGTHFQSAWSGSRASRLLAWFSLSHGRMAPFLRWMGLATNCLHELLEDGLQLESLAASYHDIEKHLLERLMCLPESEIGLFLGLSEPFRWMGFRMAYFAVMYRTGHAKEIEAEWTSTLETTPDRMAEVFESWSKEAASQDIKTHVRDDVFSSESNITQFSVEYHCDADLVVTTFADDVLGILEAVLATGEFDAIKFYDARIKLVFQRGALESGSSPISGVFNKDKPNTLRIVLAEEAGDWLTEPTNHIMPMAYLRICTTVVQMASEDSNDITNQCFENAVEKIGLDTLFLSIPSIGVIAGLIGADCLEFSDQMFANVEH